MSFVRHGSRGQTLVPLFYIFKKTKPCRTVSSACSVPIFNALKTTDHSDTHRLVGACPFGEYRSGRSDASLRSADE